MNSILSTIIDIRLKLQVICFSNWFGQLCLLLNLKIQLDLLKLTSLAERRCLAGNSKGIVSPLPILHV